MSSEFGGLLRGIVVDNNDPKKLGRIKVRVQAAYGDQPVDNLPYAWPCLPYGGMQGMHNYAVPEVGAGVWVMFQNKDGEPDTTYPVWLGVWQAEAEKPVRTDAEIGKNTEDAHYYKEFRTTSGHMMIFCDKPGEEYIEVRDRDNNFWRMDDKDDYIRVQDQYGSYILFKDQDIEIYAVKNIRLIAKRIDLN